jgi:hypothetical protein
MTSLRSVFAGARRSLRGHLGRLRQSFESLAEQVREAIARAIGRTVADAVSEAVDTALTPAERRPDASSPARPTFSSRRPAPLWEDPGESRWGRREGEPDPFRRSCAEDPDDRDPYADESGEEPVDGPVPRVEPCRGRLGRALAAGLQAAGWMLQRHPGGLSVLAAVGLGLVAGAAALVRDTPGGPAGLVGAALGLLALDGLVRSGSNLTAQAATP